jgi:hypothetical protein
LTGLSPREIAELCNYNYLKEQQQIQTQAINLAQTTLVRSNLFIVGLILTQVHYKKKQKQKWLTNWLVTLATGTIPQWPIEVMRKKAQNQTNHEYCEIR